MSFSKSTVLTLLLCVFFGFAQKQTIDSLLHIWEDQNITDSIRSDAVERVIFIYNNQGKGDSALALADEMFAFGEVHDNLFLMAKGLSYMGFAFHNTNPPNYDTVVSLYRESQDLREKYGDSFLIAEGHYWMGAFFNNKGNLDSGEFYLLKAAPVYAEHGKYSEVITMYNNMGFGYSITGNWDQALDYYYKALKVADVFNENYESALVRLYIAKTHWRLNDVKRAQEMAKEALSYDPDGDLDVGFSIMDFMAVLEYEKGCYPEAVSGFSYVIKNARSEFRKANALLNRGDTYRVMGNFKASEKDLLELYEIRKNQGGDQSQLITIVSLADLYADMGRPEEVIKYVREYQEILTARGLPDLLVESSSAYRSLYFAYKQIGDYRMSLESYEKYIVLQDSLDSDNARSELIRKEYQYNKERDSTDAFTKVQEARLNQLEAEQSRSNIIIVTGGIGGSLLLMLSFYFYNQRKKQTQRELAESQLKQQLEENRMKAVKAQFKPHFLANVQVAIQNYMEQGDSAKASEYLDNYSGMLRGVLESSDKTTVTLATEIDTLKQYMELHKLLLVHPFTYSVSVDQTLDPHRLKIPSLLLQPIVENAIKHGITPLDKAGHIKVEVRKEVNEVKIMVDDNGVGHRFDHSMKKQEDSSFGLRFVREQLEMVEKKTGRKCSFEVVDKETPNIGTRVVIVIPDSL